VTSTRPYSFRALIIPVTLLASISFAGCTVGVRADTPVPSMSSAPNVPPPIQRRSPATVHVELTSNVRQITLADGVLYNAWTFGETVPGPFIRARIGDTLEVALTNHDSAGMPHNLDFHAVTGPGGGGAVTWVAPGQRQVARFALKHAGLFVYHCGAAPVMMHVANGMYGLLLVEPEGGLPPVDHEYYVMQSEFYTTAPDPVTKIASYSQDAGEREDPSYIVFNGGANALTGGAALVAKTNETTRIFFGNAGPNKISSFHMVGLVMDRVYREGDLVSAPAHDVQTALVPPGGAAVVEVSTVVPGVYALLDHAIFRTAKGAIGTFKVTGPLRPDIYSGTEPYNTTAEMRH
jgi:copper-containing nitrite reductase